MQLLAYFQLWRNSVAKETVYLAISIQANGRKEVLGYMLALTELTTVCTELLLDLKQRILQQVLLFVADDLVDLGTPLVSLSHRLNCSNSRFMSVATWNTMFA